ncbi:MAG TPA: hypothetical protein VMA98_04890 [Candidatus Acidoferrales bacterium]|nr:hypothetical protein [Candidatus Acidoferrales bacterium]
MSGADLIGSLFLLLGALGILMSFRLASSRANPVFGWGNALFFVGPIVLAIRTLAHSLHDLDYFVFGFAIAGILIMGAGMTLRGRRRA